MSYSFYAISHNAARDERREKESCSLYKRESKADACPGSADEGKQMAPDAWNTVYSLGNLCPPLWPAAQSIHHQRVLRSPGRRSHADVLEFARIRSPQLFRAVHRQNLDRDSVAFSDSFFSDVDKDMHASQM